MSRLCQCWVELSSDGVVQGPGLIGWHDLQLFLKEFLVAMVGEYRRPLRRATAPGLVTRNACRGRQIRSVPARVPEVSVANGVARANVRMPVSRVDSAGSTVTTLVARRSFYVCYESIRPMHTGLASVSLCSIVYPDTYDSKVMSQFSDNMKVSPPRASRGLSLLLLPLNS